MMVSLKWCNDSLNIFIFKVFQFLFHFLPQNVFLSKVFSIFASKYFRYAVNGTTKVGSLSVGWLYDFRGIIIALVLYSVMSLNLGNSIDTHTANKYQRLRDSVDWTYFV